MSPPSTTAGRQHVKEPDADSRGLINESDADSRELIKRSPGKFLPYGPPSPPLSDTDMGIRIADYMAGQMTFKNTVAHLFAGDEYEAAKAAHQARRAAIRRPPTPPAEQDLVTASTQSANDPSKPTASAASPSPPNADMKTKMWTYMAAHHAMVCPPQEGAPLNGRIPPPPFGLKTVAFKPKKVTLPRFETTHGYESRRRAERIYQLKLQLDATEQEMTFAGSAPVKKNPFGSTKAKELDSGIVALETPDCLASVEPIPQRPLSTISAPGSFTYKLPFTAVRHSPPRPLSTGAPSLFTVAHDAVALARIKSNFETSQKMSPANAAVFVGNLPAGLTDLQLSRELISAFSKFGYLTVQVSRHYTAEAVKPTAILQFTHREAASKAISNSRGWHIGGRKLRIDRSSAVRHLTVWRDGVPHRTPGMPNVAWTNITNYEVVEAKRQFTKFGPFDEVGYVFTNWTFMRRPQNDGIRITFTNYGQFLAAKKALQAGEMPYKEKKPYRGAFYV